MIKEYLKAKAKEIAEEIYNDLVTEKCVGGSDTKYILVDGIEYKVEVNAFWESVRHFDLTVTSPDFSYTKLAILF